MANQPVKKKFDYEKNFSNELKGLLNYIGTDVANEMPFTSLTFDIFFASALESPNTMLYKSINGFMTSTSIDEMRDKVVSIITDDKDLTPVRPGRPIDYSPEMKNLFILSNDIREEIEANAITSDIVFLAFIRSASKSNPIRKIITDAGITEETALELVKKMRDTVSLISSMSPIEFDKFSDKVMGMNGEGLVMGVDIGDGDDTAVITMIGEPPKNLKDMLYSLAGISSPKQQVQQPQQKTKGKVDIEFCENLNRIAETGGIDPLIGRDKEIMEITKVLSRKMCNNVIMVGGPGVGKTAIVNGLAKKIVDGNAPLPLKDCEIFKFDVNEAASGTQFRGQFEQRISSLIKSLKKAKKPILFIDNIHYYVNDRKNQEFDILSALDPIFADKGVMVITSTTQKGYHASFEGNPDAARKFQKIMIDAPSEKECLEILKGISGTFEEFHGVKYSDEALSSAISLATRYITDRSLPSSAIDLMDEAGAMRKIEVSEPEKVRLKRDKIAALKKKKDLLIKRDNMAEAKDIDYEIDGLNIDIAEEMDKVREFGIPVVTDEDMCKAVSEHTGIPAQKINVSEKKQLSQINKVLSERIIGQDEAIEIISRGIKRNKIGLVQKNRPILSCMCIGNTGVGKTLLAKTLAKEIFGDEKYLVRFDMSEYADKTAVNKMIGASAGYVGYGEGGLLTEAIKNKRHAVLLIDEIEKATDEIFNIFLQILDEGFLTDNTGYKVDFKNTILILTSNVGAKDAANSKPLGFSADPNGNKRDIIEKELKNRFPPEFLNRLDEIVYFNSFTDENLKEIIKLELNVLSEKIKGIGYSIKYDDGVVDFIFKIIEPEKEYGARPIGRAIQREIENRITDYIIENECDGKEFVVSVDNGTIKIG